VISIRWLPAAALAVALLLPLLAGTAYTQVLLNLVLINAILVLGFYVIFGLTGIFSVAQVAFMGIGSYTVAILTVDYHWNPWFALVAAPVMATLFGILLGLPTLKLKTHYLTMATIGFAEVVRLVLINWDQVTHGTSGISGIPAPPLGPIQFETPRAFYYLGLTVLVVVVIAVMRLRASRIGRNLEAIRDDEIAAETCGVRVTAYRVMAFAISAFISGLAGGLYAFLLKYVSPDAFTLEHTVQILAMLMIGGRGSVAGAMAGAAVLTYLPEALRAFREWYMAIYGGGLLAILIFLPDGIAGLVSRVWKRIGGAQV
jgi:branched-chain amino acid transport system permease protein